MKEHLYELIYDRTFRRITGFQRLPANTVETVSTATGEPVWIAHPEKPEYRRFLLKYQVLLCNIGVVKEIVEQQTDYFSALRIKRNHKIDNLLS